MTKILVLHGPNLNLLGTREPSLYGQHSLNDIDHALKLESEKRGYSVESYQSNAEHQLVEKIHQALADEVDFIIFNPAAFTHSSIALRDALLAVNIPFIEVHLSNTYARESFRQASYFSDIAQGVIVGLGAFGYLLAFKAASRYLQIEGDHSGHPKD